MTNSWGGLPAGTHYFWIQDETGCSVQGSVVINQPNPVSFTVSSALSCQGSPTGVAYIHPSGGNGYYQVAVCIMRLLHMVFTNYYFYCCYFISSKVPDICNRLHLEDCGQEIIISISKTLMDVGHDMAKLVLGLAMV